MKLREGKSKVPVVPRTLQIIFASVSGTALVALVIFVMMKPTVAEPSLSLEAPSSPVVTIDGFAQELSTVETKKPVIISEQVQQHVTVDGAAEEPAKEEAAKVAVEQPKKEEGKKEAPAVKEEKTLTYTVRPGDSYTAIVRAAVTRTMEAKRLSLSPAQRVAAETYLVQAAGAPVVDVAQTVTLSVDAISQAIDQAQSLTDEELAAWDVFAAQVDFDEDDTPEPAVDGVAGANGVSDTGASDTGVSGGSVGGAGSGPGSGN